MQRAPNRTDRKDKADCTKKYYTSRPDITSFISLQCPCQHPKVIGFTLLKEVESIAMAISTMIEFLNIPPRTVWYDNACNLYDYTLLRAPFLLRTCRLIVDRFHFQGHSCSNHYNPDRYESLVDERSVAAEVMNSVLEISASFIRYLKGENKRTYLRILFTMHNFAYNLKDDLNRNELPLLDIGSFHNRRFPCTCLMCLLMDDSDLWQHATTESVSYEPIYPDTRQRSPNGRGASATECDSSIARPEQESSDEARHSSGDVRGSNSVGR